MADASFKNFVRLGNKDCSLVLPVAVLAATISVSKRPWIFAALELLLNLLRVEAHLFKEAVNHIFPAVTFTVVTVVTVAVTMSEVVLFMVLLSSV